LAQNDISVIIRFNDRVWIYFQILFLKRKEKKRKEKKRKEKKRKEKKRNEKKRK
jgi:hypothetical protein